MSGAVNGGVPKRGPRRIGPIGVPSRSASLADREASFKALARELLRQAQLAANRGDEEFTRQRLSELERVVSRLGPNAGQFRAAIDRLRGVPKPPAPRKRRRGPARLCVDCGVRDAAVVGTYCDGCASRYGWLSCRLCGRSFKPGKKLTVQFPQCQKCSNKHVRKGRGPSVRTVSGGLPTLGKRR